MVQLLVSLLTLAVDASASCCAPEFRLPAAIERQSRDLEWSAPSSSPSLVYDLEISADRSFRDLAHQVGGLTQTRYAIPVGALAPDRQHWWRVRARDSALSSPWSEPQGFRSDPAALAAPTPLTAPATAPAVLPAPAPSPASATPLASKERVVRLFYEDLELGTVTSQVAIDLGGGIFYDEVDYSDLPRTRTGLELTFDRGFFQLYVEEWAEIYDMIGLAGGSDAALSASTERGSTEPRLDHRLAVSINVGDGDVPIFDSGGFPLGTVSADLQYFEASARLGVGWTLERITPTVGLAASWMIGQVEFPGGLTLDVEGLNIGGYAAIEFGRPSEAFNARLQVLLGDLSGLALQVGLRI